MIALKNGNKKEDSIKTIKKLNKKESCSTLFCSLAFQVLNSVPFNQFPEFPACK